MLCSECKKNPAILFYEKIDDGKKTMEGLCYDCANKKGINAMETLAHQQDILSKDKVNLNDMSKQLETIFKDLAENINLEDIENIDGAITFNAEDTDGDDENTPKFAGAAIPLGSLFSSMMGNNSSQSEEDSNGRKKVKVEKKKNQNRMSMNIKI